MEPDETNTIGINRLTHDDPSRRVYSIPNAVGGGQLSTTATRTRQPVNARRPEQRSNNLGWERLRSPAPSIHPHFRSKAVCTIYCQHCANALCERGMRAILLGNTSVELYSTDRPPFGVELVEFDYKTENCRFKILIDVVSETRHA